MQTRMTDQELELVSRDISEKIVGSDIFQDAETILAYLSFNKEISVDVVIEKALSLRKRVFVPRIIGKNEFVAASLESLENLPLDRYGIRTVNESYNAISPDDIDLILVPGVAFTLCCRLFPGVTFTPCGIYCDCSGSYIEEAVCFSFMCLTTLCCTDGSIF